MGSKNRVRIMCKTTQDVDDDRPLLLHKKRTRRSSSFASFPSFTPTDSSKSSNGSILSCVGISSLSKRVKNGQRNLVTLIVGEEQRAFPVEPQILDHGVVQYLLEKTKSQLIEEEQDKENDAFYENRRRVRAIRSRSMDRRDHHTNGLRIRVDCDAILFEHILWLLSNDDPSLRYLNVDELMEFYS